MLQRALAEPGEEGGAFAMCRAEELLRRWVNCHIRRYLEATKAPIVPLDYHVGNLTSHLQTSVALSVVLHQVDASLEHVAEAWMAYRERVTCGFVCRPGQLVGTTAHTAPRRCYPNVTCGRPNLAGAAGRGAVRPACAAASEWVCSRSVSTLCGQANGKRMVGRMGPSPACPEASHGEPWQPFPRSSALRSGATAHLAELCGSISCRLLLILRSHTP